MIRLFFLTGIISCISIQGCTSGREGTNDVKSVPISELKIGDLQHDTLTKLQLERIRTLSKTFQEVSLQSYAEWVDSFKRDMHPDEEIVVWEEMASVYISYTKKHSLLLPQKAELFELLLMRSMMPVEKVLEEVHLKALTKQEAISAMNEYRRKEKPLTVKE